MMVVRRVMVTGVTAVTVYLVLVLVVPSRLTRTIATVFLGVRAIRPTVAAVASHTRLPPSVSVIVTKLAEFLDQTATRVNERGVCSFGKSACLRGNLGNALDFLGGQRRGRRAREGRSKEEGCRSETKRKRQKLPHNDALRGASTSTCYQPKGRRIDHRYDNRIITRPHLP